jgi:hypothetical protein
MVSRRRRFLRVASAWVLGAAMLLGTASCMGSDSPKKAAPFLWGVATSSYQVEGGIDCSVPALPCNDYDFFNSSREIRMRVALNTSQAGEGFQNGGSVSPPWRWRLAGTS